MFSFQISTRVSADDWPLQFAWFTLIPVPPDWARGISWSPALFSLLSSFFLSSEDRFSLTLTLAFCFSTDSHHFMKGISPLALSAEHPALKEDAAAGEHFLIWDHSVGEWLSHTGGKMCSFSHVDLTETEAGIPTEPSPHGRVCCFKTQIW